jgi:hypothetical protein
MVIQWLAHRVIPLKKQVHPSWEYSGSQDPTRKTTKKIGLDHVVKLLEEMFQNINSWLTDEQVCAYHIGLERDSVRHPSFDSILFP